MKRIIVGISGATGAQYGLRTLEVLATMEDVETHLIVTSAARQTIEIELERNISQVFALADQLYDNRDIAASISSGSYKTDGMIIAPCSIRSLSMIAHSLDENLLIRAADVTLKERRRLVLLPRETPLHIGHLRTMTAVAEIGAIIMPPVPALYSKPKSVDDIINQTIGRALDLLGLEPPAELFKRWQGPAG